MDFSFKTAGNIIFGAGKSERLGLLVKEMGSSVMLVTGRASLKKTGLLDKILADFDGLGIRYTVFNAVPPEPTIGVVEDGVALANSTGADVIAAVGGGSALDVGKAIAALAPSGVIPGDFFHGEPIPEKGLPFIAVPTTAGTGTEVTMVSVLIEEESLAKVGTRSPYMFPDAAIIDPALMLSVPPDVTANSGMDALCQAIEAYVSKGASPITDALASDAAQRMLSALPRAYEDGGNLANREEMALGSLMGGMAFANARLGLVHGMAHPVGVRTHLPHGLICGLLLPAVIRFNTPVCGEKYARLAWESGLAPHSASAEEAAEALAAETDRLNSIMGLSARKGEMGIQREEWPAVVEQVLVSGSTKSNPRDVTPEDVLGILEGI
jgi:alcohol dehydrogenase class IV